MTDKEIVDYVMNTPHNTNPVILTQMLKQTSGSGNVELDTTLTQSGKAAEAKAVGDALKSLADNISPAGIQSDWNVNDPEDSAFIINRPFYEHSEFISSLSLTTTRVSDTELSLIVKWKDFFESLGDWSGKVRYADLVLSAKGSCDYNYGNYYLIIDGTHTTLSPYSTVEIILTGNGFTEDSYLVEFGVENNTIKKIDEKFIPDNVMNKLDAADTALSAVNDKISYGDSDVIVRYPAQEYVNVYNWEVNYCNGRFFSTNTNDKNDIMFYSKDGITWIESKSPISTIMSTTCCNNKLIVYPKYYDELHSEMYYSEDGVTWTVIDAPGFCTNIFFGNNKYYLVSNHDFYSSEDLITWTRIDADDPPCTNVYCYNNKFFCYSESYGVSYCSDDAITWVKIDCQKIVKDIIYYNDKFVAILADPNVWTNCTAAYSEDGITWIETELPQKTLWEVLSCSNNILVALASNTNVAAYSKDGIAWTEIELPVEIGSTSAVYGDDKFVAVGPGSSIIYSEDGITWTDKIKALIQNDKDITSKVKELLKVSDSVENVVQYVEQELTDEQKAQARTNIGAASDAKSPLVVTLSDAEDGTLIASHNYEEISAACAAGRDVVLYVDYLYYDAIPYTEVRGAYFMLTMLMDEAEFTSTVAYNDRVIKYVVSINHMNQAYSYRKILDLNNYTTKEYAEENFQKKKMIVKFYQIGYDDYILDIPGQELKDAIENGFDIVADWNEVFYELVEYKTGVFNTTNNKELIGATFKKFNPDTFDVVTIEIKDYLESGTLDGTVTTNTTTIPTKTSELENDNGFITVNDIPESNFSTELSSSLSGFFTKFETLLHQLAYVQTDHIGEELASDAKALVKILNNISLVNLTATYSGGYVTIGTNLDNLRKYITVTGTYTDGTVVTITDYELSGTIIDGESMLTITREDVSTMIIVTGTPNTYLYSPGFEYTDVTGGWVNEGNIGFPELTEISKNNNSLYIKAAKTTTTGNPVNTYATKNTIDLTKYSKFVIDGEFTISGTNGSSNVRATSTLNTDLDFNVAYEKSVVVFNAAKSTTTNNAFEVDLSTIDFSALDASKVYIALSAGVWANNTNASCNVRNIYLVPKAV